MWARWRPAFHDVIAAGLVATLVTGCSGGDGDVDREDADDGEGAEAGALPDAVCDDLAEPEETERSLRSPEVFTLDETVLRDVLATRRALLSRLTPATSGEVHDFLQHQMQAQPAFDEAMLGAPAGRR